MSDEDGDGDRHIIEFLQRNTLWHLVGETTWHSWPCGIWMDSCPRKTLSWTDLFIHGLIPRNYKCITEEPF